jgi:hypothetical protein
MIIAQRAMKTRPDADEDENGMAGTQDLEELMLHSRPESMRLWSK